MLSDGPRTTRNQQTFLQHCDEPKARTSHATDATWRICRSKQVSERSTFDRIPDPEVESTVSVGGGMEAMWAARGDEVFYRSLNGDRMFAVPVTDHPNAEGRDTGDRCFKGPTYIPARGSPRPQYDVTADGQRFLMLAPPGAPTPPSLALASSSFRTGQKS